MQWRGTCPRCGHELARIGAELVDFASIRARATASGTEALVLSDGSRFRGEAHARGVVAYRVHRCSRHHPDPKRRAERRQASLAGAPLAKEAERARLERAVERAQALAASVLEHAARAGMAMPEELAQRLEHLASYCPRRGRGAVPLPPTWRALRERTEGREDEHGPASGGAA